MVCAYNLAFVVGFGAFAGILAANVDTYPVKSINLDKAFDVNFYDGYDFYDGLIPGLSEAHVVNGIELASGNFVIVGSATPSGLFSSGANAFALMIDADGTFMWGWAPSREEYSTAFTNGVVELPNGAILLAGVVADKAGVAYRSLTKLSATGKELWTTSNSAFGDKQGSSGAWEMADGGADAVVLSGFAHNDCGTGCADELGFKSGGITWGGQAVVMKIPFSAFSSDAAAPSASQIADLLSGSTAWSATRDDYMTGREARISPDEQRVAVLFRLSTSTEEEATALGFLSYADGSITSAPLEVDTSIGQGTSIAIGADGNVAMTGLSQTNGRYPRSSVTVARLSLFSGSDGQLLWSKSFSVGGEPELIRHECWGVIAIPNNEGYVITCGTGIEPEQCNLGLPKDVRKNCTSGKGDNRPGAVPRPPDVWSSMCVMTDTAGELKWQRVDSYREPGSTEPVGAGGSSSAEWGTLTKEGGVLVMMDDPAAGSLGLMKLQPQKHRSRQPLVELV